MLDLKFETKNNIVQLLVASKKHLKIILQKVKQMGEGL